MTTPYEQDLTTIRRALNAGADAKSNYEILQQHRPLVDAIRFALGLLDRMRPGDEALRNTVLMFRMAYRLVKFDGGRIEYLLVDKGAAQSALARIDQLMGPFDES